MVGAGGDTTGGRRAAAGGLLVSVDIGTGSVRAAVFRADGSRASGTHARPLVTRAARPNHYEQCSQQVWTALCGAVRAALADVPPSARAPVAALGFAATCSLAAVDATTGTPVSVSEAPAAGQNAQADDHDDDEADMVFNIVLWMDHRAAPEARELASRPALAAVARHFGGVIPTEGQPARLAHLSRTMRPDDWARASWFDLADWAAWRCTGGEPLRAHRSACPAAAKWGWGCGGGDSSFKPGAPRAWHPTFWADAGLADLAGENAIGASPRIQGSGVIPAGARAGILSRSAAEELGIPADDAQRVHVAATMVDAHAGALAMLAPSPDGAGGSALHERAPGIENRVAFVCGTSTCMLAASASPVFVPGVWGPFPDAVVPGMWATEGGQTATGSLVDHVLRRSSACAAMEGRAEREGRSLYALLEEACTSDKPTAGDTSELHMLPYFHGNRSPRADASLRGTLVGLTLSPDGEGELALLFRATLESLALGARHIVETMNEAGHKLKAVVACGGLAKSDLYLQLLADALRMPVFTTVEPDTVLSGAAILAAAATEDTPPDGALMESMSAINAERMFEPRGENARFLDRKYAVFLRMYDDFVAYRHIMNGA